ncbi:hypothetical protein Micbo1qcDRAFT_215717 [Microdochium bolleyi]|uniref:Extracellular membrane protein CFEM domain-containing protein n=1 Tax=Microdochium bolleyi TaxID=196109 RepID=A0A136IS77_9PEZI|nr:hypothetical protein Micbo1qcDRAFT_215717 [Microdochium bolleyi]
MLFTKLSVALAPLIISQAAAIVPAFDRRTSCANDKCLQGVHRGPLSLSGSYALDVARSDCLAFADVTVIPCDVVTTTTVTSYFAASTATEVLTETTTSTELTSVTIPTTTTTTPTITTVVTESSLTTITDVSTTTSSSTSTANTVVTVTQTSTAFQPAKRTVLAGSSTADAQVTCPTTQSGAIVPCYAHCGKNPEAYSSACSCLGYTGTTQTLSASTSTATVTVTESIPVTTITETTVQAEVTEATATITTLITLVEEEQTTTETTTVQATTTISTVEVEIDQTVVTSTSTVTETTTVPTTCIDFQMSISGGALSGRHVRFAPSGAVVLTPDASLATTFRTDSVGRAVSGFEIFIVSGSNIEVVPELVRHTDFRGQAGYFILCDKAPTLSCARQSFRPSDAIKFYTCPSQSAEGILIGAASAATPPGCEVIFLNTSAAPSCNAV